jgi:hypothetical protein
MNEKTLSEVVLVRKKFKIKNPFEEVKQEPTQQIEKKKNIGFVIGGGILLGLVTWFVIKSAK